MYRQCSPAGLSKKKFLTKNVDRWSECNKSLISSKYEIVLEREICSGVQSLAFGVFLKPQIKPMETWNNQTYETMKRLNHKTHANTKPVKP